MGKKLYIFTVSGRGKFPVDMLRYDACYPATEVVSNDLNENLTTRQLWWQTNRFTLVGHKEPTTGRWASFGWTVDRVNERRIA